MFEHQQRVLGEFYTLCCPALGAPLDLDSYVSDLARISADSDACLVNELSSSSSSNSNWGQHQPVLTAAQQVAPLLHTTAFKNSIKTYNQRAAAAEPREGNAEVAEIVDWGVDGLPVFSNGHTFQTVLDMCNSIPDVILDFRTRWLAATRTQHSAVNMTASNSGMVEGPMVSEVLALWVSEMPLDGTMVAAEHQQIEQYLSKQQTGSTGPPVVSAVEVLSLLRLYHGSKESVWSEWLTELQQVFQLQESPLLHAVQQLPCTPPMELQLPAVQLAAAFSDVEQQLGVLAGHQDLLLQLSKSSGLMEFLAATGSDDLRRLTDGAEDQGETWWPSYRMLGSSILQTNRAIMLLCTV